MLHIMYCICLPACNGRVSDVPGDVSWRRGPGKAAGSEPGSCEGGVRPRPVVPPLIDGGPAASTASPTPAPRPWRRRWRTSRRSCPSTSGAYTPARRQASAAHAPLAQGRVSASPSAPSHAPLDRSRARGCRYGYGHGLARSPARGALFSPRPAVSRDLGGLRRGCGPARGPSAPRAMSRDSVPGVEGCKACRAARRSP